MTNDLERLRRLSGILNETAPEPIIEVAEEDDCDVPPCEDEESIAEAYARFMGESPVPGRKGYWDARRASYRAARESGDWETAEKIADELTAAAEFEDERADESFDEPGSRYNPRKARNAKGFPGGYDAKSWHVCDDCHGHGTFLDNGPSGTERECDTCGGEGGWPKEILDEEYYSHCETCGDEYANVSNQPECAHCATGGRKKLFPGVKEGITRWEHNGHGYPKPVGHLPDHSPEEIESERVAAAKRVAAKRAARAKLAK
jgi:hypothetical protein